MQGRLFDGLISSKDEVRPTKRNITHASFLIDAQLISQNQRPLTNADYSSNPIGIYSQRIDKYVDGLSANPNITFASTLEKPYGPSSGLTSPTIEEYPRPDKELTSQHGEEVKSTLDDYSFQRLIYPEICSLVLEEHPDLVKGLPTTAQAHDKGQEESIASGVPPLEEVARSVYKHFSRS